MSDSNDHATYAAMMTSCAKTLTASTEPEKKAAHDDAVRLAGDLLKSAPVPDALIVAAATSGLSVANNLLRVTKSPIDLADFVWQTEADVIIRNHGE